MNAKLISALLLLLLVVSACSDDRYHNNEEDGDGLVRLKAAVAKSNPVTRADETKPGEGEYYLYYTPVTPTSATDTENGMNAHQFICDDEQQFSADPLLYWDDIKGEGTNTTFYLTNTEAMTFSPKKENTDILWGSAMGWNKEFSFELEHLTAKITVILYDNTLNKGVTGKKVDFSNAKVIFYPGLITKTEGINYIDGKILYNEADKEKTTTISRTGFSAEGNVKIEEEEYNGVVSKPLYIVPQEFADTDSLEITAGKYVYRIPVSSLEGDSQEVKAGDHLAIYIQLTEDEVTLTATLKDWNDIKASDINVSRVFNISNWAELKDLMQAINTGYTFKGMVVRLTKNIDIEGQITLGTEEHPFEGIFDGDKYSIRDLGNYTEDSSIPRNKGGFFGYTSGATLQNITLEAPYIATDGGGATGSLVNTAVNTTLFNCKVTTGTNAESGTGIQGSGDNIGGMVGMATGESTLINCYSSVAVALTGAGEYVGGLIGYSEAAVTHCCATGQVDASSVYYVGGLAGYQSGVMQYCYAQGEVDGNSQVGGLIGYLDGEASYSYASGNVYGSTDVGGLFGNLGFDGIADKCFWKEKNSGEDNRGAGSADLSKTTCKSFSDGSILLDPEYLNNSETNIWELLNGLPVFIDMN